ncbi:reticulate body protein Rbp-7 [Chlamydia sp.]|uniref:reticulate body protein Rbp-7 n=1 Tax=Chlamydia sp. TaxID=35827 RepID=UPI0025C2D9B5|nr:reticulate body protein Rbp-7 [Chlamydia sp.]MBQ8498550.1 reticulate body protein Rbp-7 [Chlamydia sp.]
MQHTVMLSLENDNQELASMIDRVVAASSSILSISHHSKSDQQFTISKAPDEKASGRISHIAAAAFLE